MVRMVTVTVCRTSRNLVTGGLVREGKVKEREKENREGQPETREKERKACFIIQFGTSSVT